MEKIKILDKSNMLEKLLGFPKQCREGYSIQPPTLPKREFTKVLFCGMGGSAIGGDFISVIAKEGSGIPCFVNRDYTLPYYVDKETLAVAVSYSGNTEETLSALNLIKERGSLLICISSNGTIESMANIEKIPFLKIPGGFPPRSAMGYLFFPSYKIMSLLGVLPPLDEGIFSLIEEWTDSFLPEKIDNKAREIAERAHNKIPLLYSGEKLFPAGLRWKTQIAENSKSFSFVNILPEMNHNEIMSWRYPLWFIERTLPIFFLSKREHPRTAKRFQITREIISQKNSDILEIEVEGENLLEELFYLTILGDWVSFYLAILNNSDPTEIAEIDFLKKGMGG